MPILLLLSLALNVAQAERLRERADEAIVGPTRGSRLPPLELVAPDGSQVVLPRGVGALPTITYYFDSSCGWCERNWRAVAALEKQTRTRYRFLAVSNEPEGERLRAHHLEFPLYVAAGEAQRRAYRFRGTPHTLVLSAEGRVLRSWPGAYRGALRKEIEAYFGLSLPEVAAQPPPR